MERAMRLTIEILAAALLAVLHHRHQRSVCRRQGRRRRPRLLIQGGEKRIPRGALRRNPPTMRRKVLRELLWRQDAVGDVSQSAKGRRRRAPL
jgi:hypothetical protein